MRRPTRARTLAVFLVAGLAGLAGAARPALAAERGPSTAAERRRAVEITRRLERTPLAQGANADRIWLLKWINDIPDIVVRTCSGLLDTLPADDGEKFGRKLFAQSMFGMTAYMIEHPAQKGDWVAVQTAGIESTLKAYEALLKAKPAMRWEELDRLLSVRDQGRLAELVESQLEDCGEEHPPGPGEAI